MADARELRPSGKVSLYWQVPVEKGGGAHSFIYSVTLDCRGVYPPGGKMLKRARLSVSWGDGTNCQHLLVGTMNLGGAKLPRYRLSACKIPRLAVLGMRGGSVTTLNNMNVHEENVLYSGL